MFSCVAIITIVACSVDKSTHHQTKYQNQSGVNIKLIGRRPYSDENFEVQISNGKSWESKVELCPYDAGCDFSSLGLIGCDSVCIIFNEDRVLSYIYEDKSDSNPLDWRNYKKSYNKKTDVNTSLFTFTREMYDAATPIEK